MSTLAKYEQLGFAEERFYQFPNIINLEVFRGLCPCSCIHCPVGRLSPEVRSSYFGKRSVSLKLVEKIVSEMKLYPHSTLRLHSVGDPIMWHGLSETIEYIHSEHINSWIFTSLVSNDTKILESIARNCAIVEVSINSIDALDYRQTKGIDAFDIVKKNIIYISQFIKNHRLPTRLVVSRVQSSTEVRDREFVKFWKSSGLVDDAFVRSYHNYNNILDKGSTSKLKPPCLVHWMRFNISCDGLVVSCFNELFRKELRKDVIIGNISNSSIYDIWHGEYMRNLRQAELSGYNDGKFDIDFPCRKCSFCQAYDKASITSEFQINRIGTHDTDFYR